MREAVRDTAGTALLFGLAMILLGMAVYTSNKPVRDPGDGWCDKLRCENPSEYWWESTQQELCSWHRED